MESSFLEYYKTILEKVSFDDWLYTKEFEKAKRSLSPREIQMLKAWIKLKRLPEPISEADLFRSKASERKLA